jgi:hypothetical protein
VLSGRSPAGFGRPVVARSWSRVLALGLDPNRVNPRSPVPGTVLHQRLRDRGISAAIGVADRAFAGTDRSGRCVVSLADRDGVIVWRTGAGGLLGRAADAGFREGSTWTESTAGTNAIGVALADETRVRIVGAEHYEACQIGWYCSAAPIRDPRTGRLLAVLNVSGPAPAMHPMAGALVQTAADLVEARLHRDHRRHLDRLRAAHAPRPAEGGFLLVDDHGWVAHDPALRPLRRIPPPRPQLAVDIPGWGRCLPERVEGGWVIRRERGVTPPPEVVLRLDGPRPGVEVPEGAGTARIPLSPRHAEILVLLRVAGAAGLDTAALSDGLYGDAGHAVAVRAEVTRLRRALGVLGTRIGSRPYRLRDLRLTITAGAGRRWQDCAFVRGSTAPGLARARR